MKGRGRAHNEAHTRYYFLSSLLSFSLASRYLRAQKFDVSLAKQKLTATLVWRREQGLADDDGGEGSVEEGGGLNAELIKEEGRSGKE